MDAQRRWRASYASQANAVMRKNLLLQRRRYRQSGCLILLPALLCLGLFGLQFVINRLLDTSAYTCGCSCVPRSTSTGGCEKICGVEYSDDTQALTCEIPTPPQLPAFMQVPRAAFRAVDLDGQSPGFPSPSCRASGTCPLVFLYTGESRSIAEALVGNMLGKDQADPQDPFSTLVPGTSRDVPGSLYLEPALPLSFTLLQPDCTAAALQGAPCTPTTMVWRSNKSVIDGDLYGGYSNGDRNTHVNGVPVAYDFQSTNTNKLEVSIFFNVSFRGFVARGASPVLRVAKSMNLASKAFVKMVATSAAELPLSFLKDVPKPKTKLSLDFSTLLGPLAYSWVVQLLFPVMLISLVYEKQHNLRMMMKIHGLNEAPYWFISYVYFLVLSTLYIFCFILFGSLVGLDYFRWSSYIVQLLFYMVYLNLQIALAFFAASIISNVTTATVVGYFYIFVMGLSGQLFENLYQDPDFSRAAIIALELIPGFSLYRGLYEFKAYTAIGADAGTHTGMHWHNLKDSDNGLLGVVGIMAAEWLIFMLLAIYLDQVVRSGSGVKKHPLFFLESCFGRSTRTVAVPSNREAGAGEPADVVHERAVVESLQEAHDPAYAIICDDLKKVYAGEDGNKDKHAVRRLSLAIKSGECFGLLGPNGAGKTTSIKMMIGFLAPSSGKATVAGLDISRDMEKIYAIMGVCPQDDLLWETLTGREHLLFYGRLKNLKGPALEDAVQASLRAVNLLDAANKQARKYSGGMKRRLSVAISLIGNAKAVYMDEPSTGLDPASRRRLWSAIRRAKRNCAIILTTHSMEEAEALCDRVGIFVKGELQCIGSPKELKSRYASSYIFTVTSEASKAEEVESMVRSWSESANRVYSLSGTQKFELPKADVPISKVFKDVGCAKSKLGIQAWGLTETTLENVFIKVAS